MNRARSLPAVPVVAILTFVVLHVAVVMFYLSNRSPGTDAAVTGFPLDDAWIHLVYARSLALLQGFEYNPGQSETGFTSPLWTLCLAPMSFISHLTGISIVYVVKLLGTVLAIYLSLLTFQVARAISGLPLAGWMAGIMIALDPSLSFSRISGMEVILACVVMVFCLRSLLEERWMALGIGLACAPICRPENALFSTLVFLLAILRLRELKTGSTEFRQILPRLVLPTALVGCLWVGYCLAITGHPLPNVFYAKHSAQDLGTLWVEITFLLGPTLLSLGWMGLGLSLITFLLGIRRLAEFLRPTTAPDGSATNPLTAFFGLYPLLFVVAEAWAHNLGAWGPYYWNRYFQPSIPFWYIPIAVGMAAVMSPLLPGAATSASGEMPDASPEKARSGGRFLPLLGSLVLVGIPVALLPGALSRSATVYAGNCENINEMNVEAGKWLEQNTQPGEWVAANDAGAIRYFSNRPVLDIVGLNNHRVLEGELEVLLQEVKPRYWVVHPKVFPEPIMKGYPPVKGFKAKRYTICNCPQEELVVFMPPAS